MLAEKLRFLLFAECAFDLGASVALSKAPKEWFDLDEIMQRLGTDFTVQNGAFRFSLHCSEITSE